MLRSPRAWKTPKRVLKKREPDPAPAPSFNDPEAGHPAAAVPKGVAANHGHDLVAVPNERPDRELDVVGLDSRSPPLLVLHRCAAPLVPERLGEDAVELGTVAVAKRRDGEPFGPLRLGRCLVAQHDPHLVVTPNRSVPTALEQRYGDLVLGKDVVPDRRRSELARAPLGQLEERRAEPTAERRGMDVTPDVRCLAAGPERCRAEQSSAAVDQPHVFAGLRYAPPVSDVALRDHGNAEHGVFHRACELRDCGGVGVGREANVEAVRKRRAHRAPPEAQPGLEAHAWVPCRGARRAG